MITPGLSRVLFLLEQAMDKLVDLRSEAEGIPDFDEKYTLLQGRMTEDGIVVEEVDDITELENPNENFDIVSFLDNVVHLETGWGFSISYDPLVSVWHFIYKSDNVDHSFAIQGADLTDVLKTALRALKDIESDIEIKKSFIEFCDQQFTEE